MSIRERLLQAFEGPEGRLVSGESLADQLQVSRTAVWKHIKALQGLGFPLESAGRSGYRLTVPADSSLLRYSTTKDSWVTPHLYLNTHSTQTLAKEGATSGLPEGHLWIAEIQSKGRGRLNRKWESGYGGLWFTLLLRPRLPPSRIPPLTLLAGLCLRNAVANVCKVDPKLKWPNDVVVGSKKLAGILTEMSGQMDQVDWVVVGVGLNVNDKIPKELADRAISLLELTGKPWNRADLLHAFLREFEPTYKQFQKQGFEPFQISYWRQYGRPDQPVRLATTNGIVSGVARGVDASGAIMIESDTLRSDARRVASRRKIRSISEGEIVS